MDKSNLGDRMKGYEKEFKFLLKPKVPVIMRLDGKAFHTFTKNFKKPFDYQLREYMNLTAEYLLQKIQGSKCAYIQSDEISILITDLDNDATQGWFGWNVQKMISISAAMCSTKFSELYNKSVIQEKLFLRPGVSLENSYGLTHKENYTSILFDSRVFNIPPHEVENYFIWRQQDWVRNSVQMLGRSKFSHKQLNNKKCSEIKQMLEETGNVWEELDNSWKHGSFLYKDERDIKFLSETPLFVNNRELFRKYLGENNK